MTTPRNKETVSQKHLIKCGSTYKIGIYHLTSITSRSFSVAASAVRNKLCANAKTATAFGLFKIQN